MGSCGQSNRGSVVGSCGHNDRGLVKVFCGHSNRGSVMGSFGHSDRGSVVGSCGHSNNYQSVEQMNNFYQLKNCHLPKTAPSPPFSQLVAAVDVTQQ